MLLLCIASLFAGGVVVEDAVLNSPQAIHLLQAEFRLHAQIAILERAWNLI